MSTPRIDSRTLASLNMSQSPADLAARLGQALRFRQDGGVVGSTAATNTKGVSRPTDKVDFTSLDETLRRLGPLLRGIQAASARNAGVSTEAFNAAIQQAVQSFSADSDGAYPNGVSGNWNPDLVLGSSVFSKGLKLAETLNIELSTHGLDDQAGVYLELGSNVNKADPASASTLGFDGLQLEVAGNLGATTLSFSSGQTLGQVAAAINAVSGETGAVASVQSGLGLVIRSANIGRDAFVSVDVVHPGAADTTEIAFYSVRGPEGEGHLDSWGGWYNESGAFTDRGTELSVSFNGVRAERVGDYWTASLDGVEVAFDLDEAFINANNLFGRELQTDLGTLRSSDVREQPDGTITDFDNQFVTDSLLVAPGLEPGESLDLDFAFQGEPDAAGVFLDLGPNYTGQGGLQLHASFEIAGPDGTQELSFSSGQTLGQMVAAINSFSSTTGVQAVASGNGIALRSTSSSPGAFVSVAALEKGNVDPGEGVQFMTAYEVQGSGADSTIVGEGAGLAAGVAFRDEARELSATINGQLAQFANGYWSVHLENGVDITINVDEEAILAAGGSASLGSISKLQGFLTPGDLNPPGWTGKPKLDGVDARLVNPNRKLSPPVVPSKPAGPAGPYLPGVPRTRIDGTRPSPPIVPSRPADPTGPDGLVPPRRRLDLEA